MRQWIIGKADNEHSVIRWFYSDFVVDRILNPLFATEIMPDRLFRQPLSPGLLHLVHPTQQLARCKVCCLDPLVDDILHPCRHRDRAGVASLSLQIDNGPVVFTLSPVT